MDQPDVSNRAEHGQTTVALAAVLAIAILLVGGLTAIGAAMVDRQRAQTAADAVALAAAVDTAAANELAAWYAGRSIFAEHGNGGAVATAGSAVAEAWASTSANTENMAMPALVAIVARAEQLTGGPFAMALVIGDRVQLNSGEAARLRVVAGELGLCERSRSASSEHTTFGLC